MGSEMCIRDSVTAAETSWTNAAVPVSKDGGLVFTSIAIGTV